MMLRANEKREMRLRDEFSIGALRNAQLRIEALEGNGRVDVSAVEIGRAHV